MQLSKKLRDSIKKQVGYFFLRLKLYKLTPRERISNNSDAPAPELPVLFGASEFDLFDIPSLEIARQLSLIGNLCRCLFINSIEFDLFTKISPKECLNTKKWNKKDQQQKPNLGAVSARFNVVNTYNILHKYK